MLRLNSALFAACGAFTGRFAPFQAIHLEPAGGGGVICVASDGGKVTAIGYDPRGVADETANLLPSGDVLSACRGIKGAERELQVEELSARVTTYRKSKNETKEFLILRSQEPYPPIREALAACIATWSATPTLSRSAGRYSTALLEKAVKAAGSLADSLVLSSFDGGPLRLHGESLELMVLVMPQTAEPIPPLPDWAVNFAGSSCQGVQPG